MHRFHKSLRILLLTVAVFVPSVHAQPTTSIRDNVVYAPGPVPFLWPVVAGHPFSGQLRIAQTLYIPRIRPVQPDDRGHVVMPPLSDDLERRESDTNAKMYRDSQGRTRFDMLTATSRPALSVVEIYDPVTNTRYILDSRHRIAHRMIAPSPEEIQRRRSQARPPDPDAIRSKKDLGQKTIEGLQAQGEMLLYHSGGNDSMTEQWTSAEHQITLIRKTTTQHLESALSVTGVAIGEPDPALFRIPPGYKVKDEKKDLYFRLK